MSRWGVWRAGADGSLHVAPCDREDRMIGDHTLSPDCFCRPLPDDEEPELLIHNDRERGGYNA